MKSIRIAAVLAAFAILPATQATANDDGQKAFEKRCKACHDVKFEKHKVGPNLAGIMGRAAGTTDFKKYKALEGVSFTWDETNMDGWITDAKTYQKDHADMFSGKPTTMNVKVKDAAERASIIEYLKSK
ncbi:MAG: c-type cytochrome [Alphaproteobacteria bacterium]|nr:c-type cytochrome [Alphaproteobacteria bacterium]